MKRIIFLIAGVLCLASCRKDNDSTTEKEEPLYKITGYVVDNLNTRQAAEVSWTNELGEGMADNTGSNGEFNFFLKQGDYTIAVSKPNFNGTSKKITVNKDENIGALSISIKPAEVTTKQDTLDFGESDNSLSLSFQILSFIDDNWEITHNCPWIQKIVPDNGKLTYNEKEKTPQTATVSVQIDREKLAVGKNTDKIQVKTDSNSGTDITVLAYRRGVPPTVTTEDVVLATTTSATFNGTIINAGNPTYDERGFVYATNSPSLNNTIRRVTAPVDGVFSAREENLDLNTIYYVQAYAFNAVDTAYGNEVSFASGIELATLTTGDATNISANSAILGGHIITAGVPPYSERGVYYGVSPSPDTYKVIIEGNNSGNFSQQVTGLSSGTKYYARAYAKSKDSETAYGDDISFVTYAPVSVVTQSVSASNITTSSAKVYGSISYAGVPEYSEKGFCYGTSDNPMIETASKQPVSGTGAGYNADINNLDANAKYYVCAYAINELGPVYGNTVSFTTKIEKARVSTQAATTLSGSSVRLNGTMLADGNPHYIERGFVCAMNGGPTISDTKVAVQGEESVFSATFNYGNNYIYSYHVRAYVINADGSVSYGEDRIFFFDVIF
jgi:hypothetical protein